MRLTTALAALAALAPPSARADFESLPPPPPPQTLCIEGTPGCGEPGAELKTSSPPERPFALEARLGLWLLQEAAVGRTSHFSPGLRFAFWAGEQLELDGGYQFAYDRQGTERVYLTNTVHALDARLHYRYPLQSCALTAGAGLAGYLSTVSAYDGSSSSGVRAVYTWGLPFALGVETWVSGHPLRFEGQLATRGSRLDLLFAFAAGY